MDKHRIADRVAGGVTAGGYKKIDQRLDNARSMIKKGGRGTELGIREVEMLAHESAKLAKDLRKIQWDIPSYEEGKLQRGLLELLGD